MVQIAMEKAHYVADFAVFGKNGAAPGPLWVRDVRNVAFERFGELSFPTTHDEDWKYTNVAPIVRTPFRSIVVEGTRQLTREDVAPCSYREAGWSELVFVDGRYAAHLSIVAPLPASVRAESLVEALTTAPELVEPHLARYARYDQNAFTALNTAFVQDGAFVYVPDGKAAGQPIHLLYVATAPEPAVAVHPRNLIVVGRDASAYIVESYVSLAGGRYFTNAVTEVVAGPGSRVEHYKVLRESERAFHVATTQVRQERDSRYTSFSIAIGGELARNDLNVLLDAEGAECELDGLYLVDGTQHVDNHTLIDHAKPHGTSRELYKGVLGGKSRAVFNGKVVVRPNAQKTNAQQTNKNLLLSDDARIHTKPELQIFADDVKCTHGATVGQIDEDMVFYLKSRGIGDEAARRLLIYGFASDLISRIAVDPIRAQLDRLLLTRLKEPVGV